jgi:hypothetical protein
MFQLGESVPMADSAWSLIDDEKNQWSMFAHARRHVTCVAEVRYRIIETLEHEGLPYDDKLMRKVFTISDIEGLWFLRTDIMHDLSLRFGEQEAQTIMGDITPLFVGLVPESMFRPDHVPFRKSGY